jgi:hypothetical protein
VIALPPRCKARLFFNKLQKFHFGCACTTPRCAVAGTTRGMCWLG